MAGTPFAYQAVKQQRARQLAEKSIALAAADQPEAAREAAEAAFNLVPESPASLRARARSAATPTDAFFFGSALLATDSATPADIRHYLETCVALNFAVGLDTSLRRLLESEPGEVENWLLAARIHLLRNQTQAALGCAGRALEIDAQSRPARLVAARIALASSEENFRQAGATTIGKVIAESPHDAISLRAQRFLLPGSARHLLDHPLATPEDQLLASHHRLASAVDEARRDQIIAETIDRHRNDQLAPLVHWLNSNQLAARSLSLVDYQTARSSAELFTTWCHAMNAAGRTAELIGLVEDPARRSEIPLTSDSLELVLIDAYEGAGKSGIAELHWGKALRHARSGNRRVKLLRLAQWAERHRYPARAVGLYRTLLTESPNYAPHWYDRITSLCRESDDLPQLLEITAGLHRSVPENIVYQHNFAYLSILAGVNLDAAGAVLHALVEEFPNAGSARCALALLEKKRGDGAAMRTQLAQVSADDLDPTSGYLFQILSGKSATPPESLTPSERAALKPYSDEWAPAAQR